MGRDVFKVVYEIVGDGVPLAEAHVVATDAAHSACFDIAKSVGADGYRPAGRYGSKGILSFIFKDGVLRKGLKRFSLRGQEQGIDFIPRRDKQGKPWQDAIDASPAAPRDRDLVSQFGWDGDYEITDGIRIYFATFTHLKLPSDRYILTIPRTPDDGFVPPSTLREITEGEFMRAIADHNDAVAASRAEVA